MNDPNLPDNMQSRTDKSLPWNQDDDPEPDKCKCSECGGIFNVSDCRAEHDHHDGWEMPAYTEIYCPKCEDDGCVDDFFFSGDEDE